MPETCFLGIDTSNYTTSCAVVSEAGDVLANLKLPLPVEQGARGLRQSDALFSHNRNLPELMATLRETLTGLGSPEIAAVGCSSKPRDAKDSYMPCFLAGKVTASAMATVLSVPMYTFSHQDGHLMAAAYSSGASEYLLSRPFGAFHVSGGTTELVLAEPEDTAFSVSLIGGTEDLNAGQAIDRIGVAMGMRFPCGRELEAAALTYHGKTEVGKLSVNGLHCNLSGLENLALARYRKCGDPAEVGAFVFAYLGGVLTRLTENFRAEYPDAPVLFAGGVMSNCILQKILSRISDTYFAKPAFSADNAAGIALLTRRKYLSER